MGEYEPDESRIITQNPSKTPLEPKRTGPDEGKTRCEKRPANDGSAKSRPSDPHEAARWQTPETEQDVTDKADKPHGGA